MKLRLALSALAIAGLVSPAAAATEPEKVTLPVTIEKVWFKTPGRMLSKGGDLIVSEEGLEFIFGKRNLSFAMDEIYIVSYGQLKGDLDTAWALVGIGDDGPSEVIGIRDGKRLGYGQRTEQIYRLLLSALEQSGAGQYDVPQGYSAYDVIQHHGSLAIPDGWRAYADELVVDSEGQTWGTLVFSGETLAPPSSAGDRLAPAIEDPKLHQIMDGEIPAFFLTMERVRPGMTCDELAPKARESWLASGDYDPLARRGHVADGPAQATPTRLAFCNGLRVRSRLSRPDGKTVLVEVHAAAHRDGLYLLGLHALEGSDAAFREPFDTALETLRLSVAQ